MAQRQLIGIAGKKRSGKDTLCAMLQAHHPFERTAFAQALWDILLVTDPLIPDPYRPLNHYRLSWLNEKFGYEHCKELYPEVRRLMQRLGTEGVRNHIGQTTWLDIVDRQITENPDTSYIVSDVRFDNEAAMIMSHGGIMVKLERDVPNEDSHSSENIEAIYADVVYANNGDLNDLENFAKRLIRR